MSIAIAKPFLIIFILAICFYFIGVIYLSKKSQVYLGLILPAISACIALYNFFKLILIPNPYATMEEGIYMTFFGALSMVGLIIFGLIKVKSNKNGY